MNKQPDKTLERAWARLLKAQTKLLSSVDADLKSSDMPSLAWYDVLLEAERAGKNGLRPFELERRLLLAQYNLSRLLGRIEAAGYIERRAYQKDGRGRVVVITRAGVALRRKMWPVYSRAIQQAFGDRLTETQIGQFDKILGSLLAEV